MWQPLCTALVESHFILMYKGDSVPNTRRPRMLAARIAPQAETDPLCVRPGQTYGLTVVIENTGDTLWLTDIAGQPGWTRLGIRLHAADDAEALIDGEWQRASLPRDVAPGNVVTVQVDLPALDSAGDYLLVFDLVAEGVAWFADVNSPTTRLGLRVAPVGA